jgi:hypothetical protein
MLQCPAFFFKLEVAKCFAQKIQTRDQYLTLTLPRTPRRPDNWLGGQIVNRAPETIFVLS